MLRPAVAFLLAAKVGAVLDDHNIEILVALRCEGCQQLVDFFGPVVQRNDHAECRHTFGLFYCLFATRGDLLGKFEFCGVVATDEF